jgi:hypothetical protein
VKLLTIVTLFTALAVPTLAQKQPYSSLKYDKTGHVYFIAPPAPDYTYTDSKNTIPCYTSDDSTSCGSALVKGIVYVQLEDGRKVSIYLGTIGAKNNYDPLNEMLNKTNIFTGVDFHYALTEIKNPATGKMLPVFCVQVEPDAKGHLPKNPVCYNVVGHFPDVIE